MKKHLFALLLSGYACLAAAQTTIETLEVPGANEWCQIRPDGASVLPSGRYVTPVGKTQTVSNGAFGLALSPDEQTALLLHHNGVVTLVNGDRTTRIPDYGQEVNRTAFLGVAFSPDGRTAWLSGGDQGVVSVFDIALQQFTDTISLNGIFNGRKYEDSFTSDLCYWPQQQSLLVLDRGNNRLVQIRLNDHKIMASIPVGRIPFGIALAPDGRHVLVANAGLYQYPLAPGVTPSNRDSMMLQFPPYGVPSKPAEEGITLPDGRFIPGLGSALADEAMSVWLIDLQEQQVLKKLKTGRQIGETIEGVEIVGGASPNSIAIGRKYAYVSNATNDCISVIDWKKGRIKREIQLRFDPLIDRYRGMLPFGLCLSEDETTLYVALLGLNAVAVIDTRSARIKGYIPSGWGTTRVSLSRNGQQLYILSARGFGAGPNGGEGFVKPKRGTYVGDIQSGTLQIVNLPEKTAEKDWYRQMTQRVKDNTFIRKTSTDDGQNPCPAGPALRKSPIRHIVYITKENRTYDEIFGQLPGGKGDVSLARFGENVPLDSFSSVNVASNHLRIARQWAISDNFYCDSDASIHGHHWMTGTIPNEYVETNSAAAGRFNPFSSAPGRVFPKSTGGVDPEDYNEAGGLWEHLERGGISFYNFGECNEFAGNYEEKYDTLFGAAHPVAWAMPNALWERTCRDYAGYNTSIPDQFRVDQFERHFRALWLSGKDTMPALLTIQLPNDHTSSPRPADGYPYIHSYVADNDLALGRILEFLSHTPYWNSMLVIVTEDDPQGGVDHIDAHRSVLMMAGPYVKRGYVSHKHSNFGSILKVIYHIMHHTYANQYDATASLPDDFFTPIPDFTPYEAVGHDPRVFQPEKAMMQYHRNFNWRAVPDTGMKLDDPLEQRAEHYRQQSNN